MTEKKNDWEEYIRPSELLEILEERRKNKELFSGDSLSIRLPINRGLLDDWISKKHNNSSLELFDLAAVLVGGGLNDLTKWLNQPMMFEKTLNVKTVGAWKNHQGTKTKGFPLLILSAMCDLVSDPRPYMQLKKQLETVLDMPGESVDAVTARAIRKIANTTMFWTHGERVPSLKRTEKNKMRELYKKSIKPYLRYYYIHDKKLALTALEDREIVEYPQRNIIYKIMKFLKGRGETYSYVIFDELGLKGKERVKMTQTLLIYSEIPNLWLGKTEKKNKSERNAYFLTRNQK